jgi:microcin C transport system substrate-binding protein
VLRLLLLLMLLQRTLLPYLDVLHKLGIDASVRAPEASNWLYRMRSGTFDAGMMLYSPTERPGSELRSRFSSIAASIPFSLNWGSIRNPVLDHLINKAMTARSYPELVAATRAFDRVLLWNFYILPGMSNPSRARARSAQVMPICGPGREPSAGSRPAPITSVRKASAS